MPTTVERACGDNDRCGAGENGRHSVGTTVFGGMIMSTILNLFFIPVLYLLIEGFRERRKAKAA